MGNAPLQATARAALIRYLIYLLISAVAVGSANAAVKRFQEFSVEIPDDWSHRIDDNRPNSQGFGPKIIVSPPGGSGELKIVSYHSPVIADELMLRNFTNVDASVQLDLEEWGDFTGYQYSYSENDSYFRQWWLSNRTTILVVVYESKTPASSTEIQIVDAMVASIEDASRNQ